MRVWILTAGLLLIIGSSARAQNWPSFRGEKASGVAAGSAPTRWDAEKTINIQWKAAIPGLGHSSPVIWGDKIFLTTAVSASPGLEFPNQVTGDMTSAPDLAPHEWRVYCFDKRSGKLIWKQTAHVGKPKSKRHPLNSFATPTPAVDGQHLIVFFGSEGLYCYDLNGKLLWRNDVGTLDAGYYADAQFQWGVASSPIIYRQLAIIQCDVDRSPFIAAYNLQDGKQVWLIKRDDAPSWSTPTIYENGGTVELITNAPNYVRSYNPLTGAELWRLRWSMDIHTSTPVVAKDLIVVSSGKGMRSPIYAIRPGGAGDISLSVNQSASEQVAWSKEKGGPITTTPLLYEDYVYALTDMGVLRCYKASDGALQYEQRVSGAFFFASPVAADHKLYLTSMDGDIFVVKAGPKYELLATNHMGEVCLPTPAISEDMIFIRSAHFLFCINEKRTNNDSRPNLTKAK